MKIDKRGNVLSAKRKTNIILLLSSFGLLLFGISVYFLSSEAIGGIISVASTILCIGVLSQAATKIVMHSDRLEIKAPFNHKVLQKKSIQKVTWEWGVGVSAQLNDNSWVELPDLGNSQSVCNSIKAWLKRS